MRIGRAVGLVPPSVVDALVPAAFVAVVVFLVATEPLVDAGNPLELTAAAGGVAFVATVAVGLASAAARNRPFPATRAARWVADRWLVYGWP